LISQKGLETAISFQGTLNGNLFEYFTENFLMHCLDETKGFVLDNASPHKNETSLQLIEKTGAKVIYLPPYSPEMNPIEYCWAKIKHFFRKTKPRELEHIYNTWQEGLKLIDENLAKNCFKHCGFS